MTDLPIITLADLQSRPATRVDAFGNDDAVRLGLLAVEVIHERDLDLAVDIRIGDDLAFRARTGSTGPGNDEWLAGKALVAARYGLPSLHVRRRLEAEGVTLADEGLDARYRAHGGSIPILVGDEVVATITMSGEPDVLDHLACAEAVRRFVEG